MNSELKYIARKQELLAQITDLINTEGYANLTVRKICHCLGISTGSFYHYFPYKGELAWILFADIDDYFNNEVVRKFTKNEADNLLIFGEEYGNYVTERGVETCRYISLAPLRDASNNYMDEKRGIFQILLNIVLRGEEKKQLKLAGTDAIDTARMLMIVLRGFSADWAKHNGNYSLPEAILPVMKLLSVSLTNKE
ncbi:TetR/AcrR family transcriptional regulator [Anaerocolumna sp.]|uniref:TetR/AcrR family transcriptional regulator n=1 Tax=Anaerocolumna sp. TaxID=2041569 RepID=UPI0028A6E262|nr:TetR/AcrR family transcriptional regulator [Anaerocolumna sp.]